MHSIAKLLDPIHWINVPVLVYDLQLIQLFERCREGCMYDLKIEPRTAIFDRGLPSPNNPDMVNTLAYVCSRSVYGALVIASFSLHHLTNKQSAEMIRNGSSSNHLCIQQVLQEQLPSILVCKFGSKKQVLSAYHIRTRLVQRVGIGFTVSKPRTKH